MVAQERTLRRALFMLVGSSTLGALLFATAGQQERSSAPQAAPAAIGWYNGDWQSGLAGRPNFFFREGEFYRVYDDFVVPAGGWTVVGVFSNNRMADAIITKASWEIRRDMKPGKGGKKVASGVSDAKQIRIPGTGPFPQSASIGYRIQVDGLHVRLKPGRYWLSVAPIGSGDRWYINGTLGKNAVGDPPGNNGAGLVTLASKGRVRMKYADAAGLPSAPAQYGTARDFSQGVIIDAAPSTR